MLLGPSKPKIGFFIDLDHTLFFSYKFGICWIGGVKYWESLFASIKEITQQYNVDFIVAIVTAKEGEDDLWNAASIQLKTLISQFNPHQFILVNDLEYCLANLHGKLKYFSLGGHPNGSFEIPDNAFAHNYFTWDKSKGIKEIAEYHKILLKNCILLDDTPAVTDDARKNGIDIIPFHCFQHELIFPLKYDEDYIKTNLEQIRQQIIDKVKQKCKSFESFNLTQNLSLSSDPLHQQLEFILEKMPSPKNILFEQHLKRQAMDKNHKNPQHCKPTYFAKRDTPANRRPH